MAPGYELDVLLFEQGAELLAGEEIEVALTPGGAPGIALAGGGFHFVVVECQMNDEFGDARLKIFQGGLVEIIPLFGRD